MISLSSRVVSTSLFFSLTKKKWQISHKWGHCCVLIKKDDDDGCAMSLTIKIDLNFFLSRTSIVGGGLQLRRSCDHIRREPQFEFLSVVCSSKTISVSSAKKWMSFSSQETILDCFLQRFMSHGNDNKTLRGRSTSQMALNFFSINCFFQHLEFFKDFLKTKFP